MEQIIILALFSAWFTHWFSPLQKPKEWLIDRYIRLCMRFNVPSLMGLVVVLTCSKCFGFWFGWFYTQSFTVGLGVAMMSFLITFAVNEIEYRNGNRD